MMQAGMTRICAPIAAAGQVTSQPSTPPESARRAAPSVGAACPAAYQQMPETHTSRITPPRPMRVLSFTDDGCLKSHTAKSTMTTGSAAATRPNRAPKV